MRPVQTLKKEAKKKKKKKDYRNDGDMQIFPPKLS